MLIKLFFYRHNVPLNVYVMESCITLAHSVSELLPLDIYYNCVHWQRKLDHIYCFMCYFKYFCSGKTGNKTLYSKRTVPRGNMLYEGIETEDVLSHYYWKPVSNL